MIHCHYKAPAMQQVDHFRRTQTAAKHYSSEQNGFLLHSLDSRKRFEGLLCIHPCLLNHNPKTNFTSISVDHKDKLSMNRE